MEYMQGGKLPLFTTIARPTIGPKETIRISTTTTHQGSLVAGAPYQDNMDQEVQAGKRVRSPDGAEVLRMTGPPVFHEKGLDRYLL